MDKDLLIIKEKALNYGAEKLLPNEMVQILIGSQKVEYKSIYLSTAELKNIGLNSLQILRIKTLKNLMEYNTNIIKENLVISNPQDVYRLYANYFAYKTQEGIKILSLDVKNRILDDSTVSVGILNSALSHPREIFKKAITVSAHSIIMIHNHPSGDPLPSNEDITLTKRIKESGNILGIELLDHIIMGNGRYTSLKKEGQIDGVEYASAS